jgi:biotin transporter BioY
MIEFPNAFAGTVTIVALVGLGIFAYPWLLARRGGATAVAAATIALALLFHQFDQGSGASTALSAGFALLWALAPAITAVIVRRFTR